MNFKNLDIMFCRCNMLFMFLLSLFVYAVNGVCHFGKHPSVAAKSCRHVLDVQRDCYKENGLYWLMNESTGNQVEQFYCDMSHKGGGWLRVFYHNSSNSTACPTGFKTEEIGGKMYCHKVPRTKLLGVEDHAIIAWNKDQSVHFTEIRGYVKLLVRHNFSPDGFSDNFAQNLIAEGHVDGFQFMTTSKPHYPSLPFRPFFTYIIGSTTSQHCPVNGGTREGIQTQSYRDYSYACDEIDLNGPLDSNDFYLQELFGSHCVQCPAGSPWFEQSYAGPLVSRVVYGRLINTDNADEYIYLSEMELYVR